MATTELYLIRHGLAGEHGSYANDDERPLTEEGVKKTKQVAKRLSQLRLKFDLILTSPLVRAHQTAEILQAAGLSQQLERSPNLAPGGDIQAWLTWFQNWQQTGGQTLALTGHEPDLGEWAERLVWGEARQRLVVKKAGVIGIEVPVEGNPIGSSHLFWLTPPRFLLD
jgi:phosphohistidine phosphatase